MKDSFRGGNRWPRIFFLLLSAVICSVVLVDLEDAFDWSRFPFQPEWEVPLEEGAMVEGRLYPKEDGETLYLYFTTQGQEVRGTLHIRLLENGKDFDSWEYATDRLLDHAYQKFELDRPFRGGAEYSVELWAGYEKEGRVSVWSGKGAAGEETGLCHGFIYRDYQARNFALLAVLALFLIVVVWCLAGGDEQRLMCMMFLFLVLLHVWLLPPLAVDDGGPHFQRAYQIASGEFFSPVRPEMSSPRDYGGFGGWGSFPQALYDFYAGEEAYLNPAVPEVEDVCFFAHYFPLAYAPHAFGIWLAKLLTNSVEVMFYAARLSGALAACFLCIYALRRIPFGKRILFTIMVLPKVVEQFACVTADSLLLACTCLFLSEIMCVSCRTDKLNAGNKTLLMCLAAAIALLKSAYMGLVLLLFLIPSERFRDRRKGKIWRIFSVFYALLLGLLWSFLASKLYLIAPAAGSDSTAQLKNIFMDIPAYCRMAAKHILFATAPPGTLYQTGIKNFIQQMTSISLFGRSIGDYACPLGFLFLLLYQSMRRRQAPGPFSGKNVYLLLGSILICAAMSVTSLYVAFSPEHADFIPLCGRYFLPLVLPAILCTIWMNKRSYPTIQEEPERPGTGLYVGVMGLQGISILSVVSNLSTEIWH